MGPTVYLCAFAVAVLAANRVQAIVNVLDEVRKISRGEEGWANFGRQPVVDPDRELKEAIPLQDMLTNDLADIDAKFKKMHRETKAGIMCRGVSYLMPIMTMSHYVVITVMAYRDDAENAAREAAMLAAESTTTVMTDMATESVSKFMKTGDPAPEFGAIAATGNPDEALGVGTEINEKAIQKAQEAVRIEAAEKETKMAIAEAARLKAKETLLSKNFEDSLLTKEFQRKTAEEKLEIRNKYKKQVAPEPVPEAEDDVGLEGDIEDMLATFLSGSAATGQGDVEDHPKMLERLTNRIALKNRKVAVRDLVAMSKENIMAVIKTIKSYLNGNDVGLEFLTKLEDKLSKHTKSKMDLVTLLLDELDTALTVYYTHCDQSINAEKIYEEFIQESTAIAKEKKVHSLNYLLLKIGLLSSGVKNEFDLIPAYWKNSENILEPPSGDPIS